MAVFVVMGTSGDYSDRTEWPVRVYLVKDEAEACVLRLEAWWNKHRERLGRSYSSQSSAREVPPDDPETYAYYGDGARYGVCEIPLTLEASTPEARSVIADECERSGMGALAMLLREPTAAADAGPGTVGR